MLEYNQWYQLQYVSGCPRRSRYKLIVPLTGKDSRYVVLTTQFALNMSVQVSNKGGMVRPVASGGLMD